MDYQESRAYIKEAEKYGIVPGLDNMREIMRRLGNPQDKLAFVHVAGTNGKGSVLAYVSTVLAQAGYRVGRYVSPTLSSYLERIEICQEPIGKEAFAHCLTKVAEAAEAMTKEGFSHPTPFEIETAAAFLAFYEGACEIVLLETGMGGLLDATNIVRTTQAAVLTSIGMDHMGFLGNTLGEIAANKAGIIKKGSLAVSTIQKPEAEQKIRETAKEKGVPLIFADPQKAKVLERSWRGQKFLYEGETYEISLAGTCQIENAVLAVEVCRALVKKGWRISEDQLQEGLRKTVWGGRFTAIARKPLFIIDGAHNPDAAKTLADSLEAYFKGKDIYFIMGVFRDKDYKKVIERTCGYAREILTVQTPDNPRALSSEELRLAVKAVRPEVLATAYDSLEEAVEAAYGKAKKEDVILAFGSLSFLGEMTRIVKTREETKE